MMTDFFKESVEKKLKRCIKCSIFAFVVDDKLIVDVIDNSFHKWRYTINNLSEKLVAGLTSKIVCNDIVKKYKTHILKCYFY